MGTRWWARNQISAVCWKRIICTWIWSVGTVIADAAYGDGRTRQQFAAAGRLGTLAIKVPKRPARTHFPKEDFQIDLAAGTCTCPAGQMTRSVRRRGSYVTATAERVRPGARFTLTRRSVRPVRSAPAVWPRDRGTGGKSVCTRRKPFCRPHARSSRVGFRTLSPPPPSRGAPPGPAGATGSTASPVFRASQDRRPALSPRYRR